MLCDGGIFDNLPFFPALRVLSDVQCSYGQGMTPEESLAYLRQRQKFPALVIAAGLDSPASEGNVSALVDIYQLSTALGNNLKIQSFRITSEMVYNMTDELAKAYEQSPGEWNSAFADSIVSSAVLDILPRDPDHLNGTFAFCRATGLNHQKMRLSMALAAFRLWRPLPGRP